MLNPFEYDYMAEVAPVLKGKKVCSPELINIP
jgi:hypothetical protein